MQGGRATYTVAQTNEDVVHRPRRLPAAAVSKKKKKEKKEKGAKSSSSGQLGLSV